MSDGGGDRPGRIATVARVAASLVLYSHPVSSNALKARFLLAELGLDYEQRDVSLAFPRPAAYVALNPFGRIPTLVDGELVLAESNAILRYLASREGREGRDDLYPASPRERARVDWALDAWSTQVRPALFQLESVALFHRDRETGGGTTDEADPEAVRERVGPVEEALAKWESFVADNGTVLGRFTIADCAVAPVLWRALRLPVDFSPWPKTARLREAACARPAFQAAGPVA